MLALHPGRARSCNSYDTPAPTHPLHAISDSASCEDGVVVGLFIEKDYPPGGHCARLPTHTTRRRAACGDRALRPSCCMTIALPVINTPIYIVDDTL